MADIQGAFNNARSVENTQLGTSVPPMVLPGQAAWDAMSENQRALWLINRERVDRGVHPMHAWEPNVTGVAQDYAQYLLDNNKTGHEADGKDPWTRLEENPAINACHDFLSIVENLAYFWSSAPNISLPLERAFYNWMYKDNGSSWGHRHMLLWYPYNDNSGTVGMEGFLGFGHTSGPHNGWDYGEILVLNVFDPCVSWSYGLDDVFLPLVVR